MKTYKVIGLMSGTSLDGLDLVYAHISKSAKGWSYAIKATHSVPYDQTMENRLKHAVDLEAVELLRFHNEYGHWLGEQCREFQENQGIAVDFISSHGHTVHHRPELGITFQLGAGQHLANSAKHNVICDFRSNDMALGGQGAPFVPIGDRLFFEEYDFCLNLGGISNISFEKDGERIAYDIGLANMILNHITRNEGLAYDQGGALARLGAIDEPLLDGLNALPYYRLPFPKSTGYEWFLKEVVPLVAASSAPMGHLLHTAIHHLCEQIAVQVQAHRSKPKERLLVTGGGALNHFLIETLQEKLGETIAVVVPNNTLIEFKEALVFALMGVLYVEKETNVLRSVTGATADSSSGTLYRPN